jgi:hypothetical protein
MNALGRHGRNMKQLDAWLMNVWTEGILFFLRERKSIGDGCCTRIKNALSAVKNIHLLQKNSAPLLILHLFILIHMEMSGILISTKILCVMRNIDMFKSLLKYLDKRRQSNQMDAGTRVKLLA